MSIFQENKLSSKDKKKLPSSIYGLPEERKYPLNDKKHVISAISYFGKCDDDKKKELAINIIKASKKYGVNISKDSEIYEVLNESMFSTSYDSSIGVYLEEDKPKKNDNDDDDDNDNTNDMNDMSDTPVDNDSMNDMSDTPVDNDSMNDMSDTPNDNNNDDNNSNDDNNDNDMNDMSDTPNDNGDDNNSNDNNDENNDTSNDNDNNDDMNNMSDTPDDNNNDDNNSNDGNNDTSNDNNDDMENMSDTPDGNNDDNENNDETNVSSSNNNNSNVKPDNSDDSDSSSDDSKSDSDDSSGDEENEDSSDEDEDSNGPEAIQNLQKSVFSNLTDEQIRLRTNNIKQSFIDLYNDILDLSERLILVNKSADNIDTINYVNRSLSDLKDMLKDSVTDSFDSRSLVENQIVLQRFLTIYSMLIYIIEKLPDKNNNKNN